MKKLVNKEFREYCFNRYPVLINNVPFRYLFNYLCFGSFIDKDSKQLIISSQVLSGIEKVRNDHHYNGLIFLKRFKENVLNDFNWKNPDIKNQRPRMVIDFGFDKELTLLIEKEIHDFDKIGKINFITGESYNSSKNKKTNNKETSKDKSKLQIEDDYSYNESQKIILNYMNVIKGTALIRKINSNKQNIIEAISKLDINSKKHQCKILQSILENPDIKYSHSENKKTCRLFPQHETILSLKSSIRKVACSGWTEIDFQSSQFCIISSLLDAQKCKNLISDNVNLWEHFNYIIFNKKEYPSKEIKQGFKEIIYGVCFGEGIDTLKRISIKYNMPEILECDIVKELLSKRKIWFKQIKKDGYINDVWGNAIKIDNTSKDMKKRMWEGSLAACKIQSIELEIIKSLFEFANEFGEKYEFKIMLFQHDGICCSFYNKVKKDMALEKMKKVILDKSKLLGMIIKLDINDL